jgi:hypothetical protein
MLLKASLIILLMAEISHMIRSYTVNLFAANTRFSHLSITPAQPFTVERVFRLGRKPLARSVW